MSSKGDNDTLLKSHRGSAQWMSLGTREAPLPGVTFNLSKALLKAQVSSVVLSRSGASWKPRAGLQNSRRNHGWKNPWASAHLDSGWAGKERIADLLLQAQEVRKALPGCSGTKPVLRDRPQQLAPDQGVLMARVFQHQKKNSSPLEWRWTALAIDGGTRWSPGRGAEKWLWNLTPFWSFLIVVPLIIPFLSGLWSEASMASPPPTKQSSHHHQQTAHHMTMEEGQKSSDDWPEPVWDRTRASLPSSNTGMLCFWTLGQPGRKSTCLPMMYYLPRFTGRDTRSTECNWPRLYVTLEVTWTVMGRAEKPWMVRRAKP